jgi:hypothetical protein
MEISAINNAYKDKLDITFALANEDGSATDKTFTILHWPVLNQRTGEVADGGTTLLMRLIAAELDKDNPIPVVTRQLRLLGIYSKDLTVDGKPLNFSDDKHLGFAEEEERKVPLSIQQKIAADICAPVIQMMRAPVSEESNATDASKPEMAGSSEDSSTADSAETAERSTGNS